MTAACILSWASKSEVLGSFMGKQVRGSGFYSTLI